MIVCGRKAMGECVWLHEEHGSQLCQLCLNCLDPYVVFGNLRRKHIKHKEK